MSFPSFQTKEVSIKVFPLLLVILRDQNSEHNL